MIDAMSVTATATAIINNQGLDQANFVIKSSNADSAAHPHSSRGSSAISPVVAMYAHAWHVCILTQHPVEARSGEAALVQQFRKAHWSRVEDTDTNDSVISASTTSVVIST